ncbi:MAG: ABC transporter ATP-binding protein [Spirochaetota bacterium]
MNPLLTIQNLSIKNPKQEKQILHGFDFQLEKDKIHAVIGESGSGKTTFATSILHLLASNLSMSFDNYRVLTQEYNDISSKEWQSIRGKHICLVPQSPAGAFHPYKKIGKQIYEYFLVKEKKLAKKDRILSLLEKTGILAGEQKYSSLPSELSGGERQRILIAMAIALKPDILIADEPTTALDSINEKLTLHLLYKLVKKNGVGMILITHDMRIVNAIADEVTVLQKGKFVESAKLQNGMFHLQNPYSQSLFAKIQTNSLGEKK